MLESGKSLNLKSYLTKRNITIVWIIFTVLPLIKVSYAGSNNYLIFKHVFYHLINLQDLYSEYPAEFYDTNHYGPVFGFIIAPFAVLPDKIGCSLWIIANSAALYYALFQLPLERFKVVAIALICVHEMLNSLMSTQFNPSMTALIILTFCFIQRSKEPWAAFCIVLGTFIKLYGIGGLAFFFFVKDKKKFILWLIIWCIILFCAPMLISSPAFIIESYKGWYESLIHKNQLNTFSIRQNISVSGIIRAVFNYSALRESWVILPGILVFLLPFVNVDYYRDLRFRLLILSSVLLFVVLFSSSSESPTYIIAFAGVALWFIVQEKFTAADWVLLIFAVIITSLSPSDLFPKYINRTYILPYHLKALPCFFIWIRLIYDLLTIRKYTPFRAREESLVN